MGERRAELRLGRSVRVGIMHTTERSMKSYRETLDK